MHGLHAARWSHLQSPPFAPSDNIYTHAANSGPGAAARKTLDMALRNYLYAKHLDPLQRALINMDPRYQAVTPTPRARHTHAPKHFGVPKQECSSDRRIVADDGTRKCANCADCPKKKPVEDGNPKVKVEVDTLASKVSHMRVEEVDFTRAF